MVTHSDFARTLTPNSNSGSDHAWAGNYMVVGGGVKGGEIFNEFPRRKGLAGVYSYHNYLYVTGRCFRVPSKMQVAEG